MATTARAPERIATRTAKARCRDDSVGRATTSRAATVAFNAFMSMSRAAAIVGSDGKLLMQNLMFDELFSNCGLIERIYGNQWQDCQIAIPDGRVFRVEAITMDDGWLVSAFDMTDRLTRARTDNLTKLGNGVMFRERLIELLANPQPAEGSAVLTVDLDRFKAVNDSLGHHIGDALLCLVAKRILSAVGPNDIVARLHGDEFGIIQTATPQPESATTLAARLVDLLGRSYLLDGQLIDVAASVGIALPSASNLDCDQTMKNAGMALHLAKEQGRGSFRFFEPEMDDRLQGRRNLEVDLRRALALREFSLAYQPQFNLKSRAITGFEALLRWNCPSRGTVSPLDYIPLAEETGIIAPIGDWVLRAACREAASWPGQRTVAVNVSAIQFANPGLVLTILSALGESGLDPWRLELEITESVMLDAEGAALGVLQQLRGMGVRVSLDDFGTGYSSLGYLRSFPFDKIKIDQSFVRGMPGDKGSRAIVRAIASLGESLGMATVAEGVETDDQLARIVADGCTDVQGYLISRPIPPEQITEFLAFHDTAALASDRG
ncbi:bifunctional diguanylate cyclase/phosphodiesterase [Rhodopseudomonas sp.]|uniref:putative bifunctional diguanylate cyclase/phosphodiesterase n=1 Tax=Rhodopseudomonas sp. TaxID=1078 RepID=UPI0034569C61